MGTLCLDIASINGEDEFPAGTIPWRRARTAHPFPAPLSHSWEPPELKAVFLLNLFLLLSTMMSSSKNNSVIVHYLQINSSGFVFKCSLGNSVGYLLGLVL